MSGALTTITVAVALAAGRPVGLDVRDFGATADDETDDTVSLQAAVDRGARERLPVIVPPGRYRVNAVADGTDPKSGGVLLRSHSTLELMPGATLEVIPNGAYAYQVLLLREVEDVRIGGGGAILCDRERHDYREAPRGRSTHEWGHGIVVSGARDVDIADLTIEHCTGDAIVVKPLGSIPAGNYVPSTRVRIRHNRLHACRRNNLSITGCAGVTVEGNFISGAGTSDGVHDGTPPRAGIDIEGYGEGAVDFGTPIDVIVRSNVLRGNRNAAILNYNGYGVVISGNTADGTIGYGFGTDTIISNNILRKPPGEAGGTGISGLGVSKGLSTNRVIVQGNTIEGFATGIDARGRDVLVASNHVHGAEKVGVLAYQADDVTFDANVIVGSTLGISVAENTKRATVTNNVVRGASTAGIVSRGADALVRSNRIDDSTSGIRVAAGTATLQSNSITFDERARSSAALVIDAAALFVSAVDNDIRNWTTTAIVARDSGAVHLVRNRIEGFRSASPAISIGSRSDVELTGNFVTLERTVVGGAAIEVSSAAEALIQDNVVKSGRPVRRAIDVSRVNVHVVRGNACLFPPHEPNDAPTGGDCDLSRAPAR